MTRADYNSLCDLTMKYRQHTVKLYQISRTASSTLIPLMKQCYNKTVFINLFNIIWEYHQRNAEHCRADSASNADRDAPIRAQRNGPIRRLQHSRCKRVVVAVSNCTRAMCVRTRRCHCSSTESARSTPLRLYIPASLCDEVAGLFRFCFISRLCSTLSLNSSQKAKLYRTVRSNDEISAAHGKIVSNLSHR